MCGSSAPKPPKQPPVQPPVIQAETPVVKTGAEPEAKKKKKTTAKSLRTPLGGTGEVSSGVGK